MATYVTKKCPHCGYAYQVFQSGDQRKYGCPYKTCIACSKTFWDTDIVEPALHGYENSYETMQSFKRGVVLVIQIPIGICMLGAGIWLLAVGEMIGLIGLAMGAVNAWIIGSYSMKKAYDKKHWQDIIAKRQIEYDLSMERLKNTDYLSALARYDNLARQLLDERTNGNVEHYANRPQ